MKTLEVTVNCLALYNSTIQVPDELSLEEAIEYANEHLDQIPMGSLEWVGDSGLDEENCSFAEDAGGAGQAEAD